MQILPVLLFAASRVMCQFLEIYQHNAAVQFVIVMIDAVKSRPGIKVAQYLEMNVNFVLLFWKTITKCCHACCKDMV